MDQDKDFPVFPMHFRGLLLLTGMYTLAWSAFYKWFGPKVFKWLSMGTDADLIGMGNWFGTFGLVVGLLIFVSAFYPISWIKLMLAGIVGKLLMGLWYALLILPELGWNKRSAFELIFNEFFWVILLSIILWRAKQVKEYLAERP